MARAVRRSLWSCVCPRRLLQPGSTGFAARASRARPVQSPRAARRNCPQRQKPPSPPCWRKGRARPASGGPAGVPPCSSRSCRRVLVSTTMSSTWPRGSSTEAAALRQRLSSRSISMQASGQSGVPQRGPRCCAGRQPRKPCGCLAMKPAARRGARSRRRGRGVGRNRWSKHRASGKALRS
jgi:hypothetical protein